MRRLLFCWWRGNAADVGRYDPYRYPLSLAYGVKSRFLRFENYSRDMYRVCVSQVATARNTERTKKEVRGQLLELRSPPFTPTSLSRPLIRR